MASLDLVPFYVAEGAPLVEWLARKLARTWRCEVSLRPPWFDPETAYDASRGQYNSTKLLRSLLGERESSSGIVLGVTGVDLFVPVLTFVFGEAQLGGRAAIVSLQRLRAETYGLPADEGLLRERLLKECVHELGHVAGLVHCLDPNCVMRSSTYVEHVDSKSVEFCDACFARASENRVNASSAPAST